MPKSPYLENPDRLGDVIAAIQAMGTYKFYKLDFGKWADRIVGDETKAGHWREVIEQHPEFFRMDSKREKASLVWRRQRQKLFDVDTGKEISSEGFRQLTDPQKSRISRMPLNSDELAMLVEAAIKLHATALEHSRERRWLIPIISSFLGAILGGGVLASLLLPAKDSFQKSPPALPSPTAIAAPSLTPVSPPKSPATSPKNP